jgi:hypothetical protein
VFNGSPASTNLRIPPHRFDQETMLMIGVDTGAAPAVAANASGSHPHGQPNPSRGAV